MTAAHSWWRPPGRPARAGVCRGWRLAYPIRYTCGFTTPRGHARLSLWAYPIWVTHGAAHAPGNCTSAPPAGTELRTSKPLALALNPKLSWKFANAPHNTP